MDKMALPARADPLHHAERPGAGLEARRSPAARAAPARAGLRGVLAALAIGLLGSLALRTPLKVDVVRDRASLSRIVAGGRLENVYRLQVMNATEEPQRYRITAEGWTAWKSPGAGDGRWPGRVALGAGAGAGAVRRRARRDRTRSTSTSRRGRRHPRAREIGVPGAPLKGEDSMNEQQSLEPPRRLVAPRLPVAGDRPARPWWWSRPSSRSAGRRSADSVVAEDYYRAASRSTRPTAAAPLRRPGPRYTSYPCTADRFVEAFGRR
jgi:hypothetical protein